ncbi:MAG: response regulator [Pseudomonadota bacterium]
MTDRNPDQRVLVVDDDETNLTVLSMMLEDLGVDHVCLDNGAAAIEEAEQARPRLILMDVSMPGVSGIDATKEIRRRCPEASIKIVAVTAHDTGRVKSACEEAGFDDFVPKPVAFGAIERILSDHFA